MRSTLLVAADVGRSALEGRAVLLVVASLFGFFGLLLGTLDLSVVQGSLDAFRLFGGEQAEDAWPFLNAQLGIFVHVSVLAFGIVAGSGAAPALLAPGRVEALLALPLSRAQLVVGTYLGVLGIALAAGTVAAGGVAAILAVKVGVVPWVPAVGALSAVVGFAPVYAVMLLSATLVRSAPLGVGVGFMFWLVATLSSGRAEIVALFESPIVARVVAFLIAPLPPMAHLTSASHAVVLEPERTAEVLAAGGAALAFAAAVVALATFVVSSRDY